MLDIAFVRQNPDIVRAAILNKRIDVDLDQLLTTDRERRELVARLEPLLNEVNARFDDLMLRIPSIPRPEVPIGKGEEDNVEVRRVGTPRAFDFKPKDHVDLMTDLGMLNQEGPRQFAGGRAYALTGYGALLELAVTRLTVDVLMSRGFDL